MTAPGYAPGADYAPSVRNGGYRNQVGRRSVRTGALVVGGAGIAAVASTMAASTIVPLAVTAVVGYGVFAGIRGAVRKTRAAVRNYRGRRVADGGVRHGTGGVLRRNRGSLALGGIVGGALFVTSTLPFLGAAAVGIGVAAAAKGIAGLVRRRRAARRLASLQEELAALRERQAARRARLGVDPLAEQAQQRLEELRSRVTEPEVATDATRLVAAPQPLAATPQPAVVSTAASAPGPATPVVGVLGGRMVPSQGTAARRSATRDRSAGRTTGRSASRGPTTNSRRAAVQRAGVKRVARGVPHRGQQPATVTPIAGSNVSNAFMARRAAQLAKEQGVTLATPAPGARRVPVKAPPRMAPRTGAAAVATQPKTTPRALPAAKPRAA